MFEVYEPTPEFLTIVLFVFGAVWGSFANVVIYRMPTGESVVRPGSFCRSCNTPVKWYNNVPIFAWFWLRGQCSTCKTKFSFRYSFVELLTAVLFAGAAISIGWQWYLLEALIFIFGLVVVSFIDFDHMILPDKFTLSGIVIGLVGAALNPDRSFLDALLGVLAGGGFLWAVAYLYFALRGREGMGGGDIKLLAWIGAVLGWKAIPVIILLASLVGSVVGITLAVIQYFSQNEKSDSTKVESEASESVESDDALVLDGKGLSMAIPFGPYLAGAALLYLLLDGKSWSSWYLGLHGF